jgi:ribosome biogenesis protein Tsr3
MNRKLIKVYMPRPRDVPVDRNELKKRRGIIVTDTAWKGLEAVAKKLGYKSKSSLIEAIGRDEIPFTPKAESSEFPNEGSDPS